MTDVYGRLALRSVDQSMSVDEVPHLVVTVGLVLAVSCVLVLLFFLHYIARSIVADEVIGRVAAELEKSIAGLPALDEASVRRLPGDDELPDANAPGTTLAWRQAALEQQWPAVRARIL